jgi:hypothetical protein
MKYIYVDSMWEMTMGYTREEVAGRCLKEVIGCPSCRTIADCQQRVAVCD